jgi:hypothetical protein
MDAGRQGGAGRHREPLAQRTGREVHSGQGVLGVGSEEGVVAAVGPELLIGQDTPGMQCSVEREHGMALGQHEAVAVRITRVALGQDAAIDRRQEVGDRQSGADVADAGAHRLLQHDAPDALAQRLSRCQVGCHGPARG